MRDPGGKRRGSGVMLAGLGGFLLGAATVLFVLWMYHPSTAPAPAAPSVPSAVPAPVPGPTPAPPPAATATPPPAGDLESRRLLLPVAGIRREQLTDTFNDARGGGGRRHEALDIMAPRNSPVLAVEDGRVAKLFTSKQGGLTIYQFDPTATYAYYYAHLDHYADGLKEGAPVRRGQVLGYVGSTGDASPDAPHLHFSIFRLTPEKQWWRGEPINPFGLLGR